MYTYNSVNGLHICYNLLCTICFFFIFVSPPLYPSPFLHLFSFRLISAVNSNCCSYRYCCLYCYYTSEERSGGRKKRIRETNKASILLIVRSRCTHHFCWKGGEEKNFCLVLLPLLCLFHFSPSLSPSNCC